MADPVYSLFNDVFTSPSTSSNFPLFAKLPAEIRVIIWNACIPARRLISIRIKRSTEHKLFSVSDDGFYATTNPLGNLVSGPPNHRPYHLVVRPFRQWSRSLLYVNYEASQTYRSFYRLAIPLFSDAAAEASVSPRLLLNPESDIIFADWWPPRVPWRRGDWPYLPDQPASSYQICTHPYTYRHDAPESELDVRMAQYLSAFAAAAAFFHDAWAWDPCACGISQFVLDRYSPEDCAVNCYGEELWDGITETVKRYPAAEVGFRSWLLGFGRRQQDQQTRTNHRELERSPRKMRPNTMYVSVSVDLFSARYRQQFVHNMDQYNYDYPVRLSRAVPILPEPWRGLSMVFATTYDYKHNNPGIDNKCGGDPRPLETETRNNHKIVLSELNMQTARRNIFWWRRILARFDIKADLNNQVRCLVGAIPGPRPGEGHLHQDPNYGDRGRRCANIFYRSRDQKNHEGRENVVQKLRAADWCRIREIFNACLKDDIELVNRVERGSEPVWYAWQWLLNCPKSAYDDHIMAQSNELKHQLATDSPSIHEVAGAWVLGADACGEIPPDNVANADYNALMRHGRPQELEALEIDLKRRRPGLLVAELE